MYCLSGEGVLMGSGTTRRIGPRTLVLRRPFDEHILRPSSAITMREIAFRVVTASLRDRLMATAGHPYRLKASPIPALLERIRVEADRRLPLYHKMCALILTEILVCYLREHGVWATRGESGYGAPDDSCIRRAVEFLEENYTRPVTVTDIARAQGTSERTLGLRFRRSAGVSPLKFLQSFRIAKAKALIEDPEQPFKQIAGAVGFSNVHHFTRVFTQIEGIPPGAWRRKHHDAIFCGAEAVFNVHGSGARPGR